MYNPNLFDSPAAAVRSLGIWVGLACMALAIVPAFFCRSPSTLGATHLQELSRTNVRESLRTFAAGFRVTFQCEPFRRMCAATFLVFNSFQTTAAFTFFVIVYHLFDGDAAAAGNWPAWFGTVSALCTTFLVIPLVTAVSERIGKTRAFMLSQAVSIVGYALFWWCFRPGTPLLILAPLPLYAFGIGGLFTLMSSMTADVCDLDELNTGARREGTFGAIYWWMVKFGMAVAGGLSGLIMAAVGFTPDAALQPEGAVTGLRIAYSVVPILGSVLAIWVMRGYDLDERRAREIREQLEQRRGRGAFA